MAPNRIALGSTAYLSSAQGGVEVTPDNDNDLAVAARAVFIGTGGTLKVTHVDGTTPTYINLASGTVYDFAVKRIWATGTTADDIIALL